MQTHSPLLASFSYHFSSVAQLCPTLCDPMNRSTPGLPVHQLPLNIHDSWSRHLSLILQDPCHPNDNFIKYWQTILCLISAYIDSSHPICLTHRKTFPVQFHDLWRSPTLWPYPYDALYTLPCYTHLHFHMKCKLWIYYLFMIKFCLAPRKTSTKEYIFNLCVCVWVPQSCPTICDPMDCNPRGSSVHGISQARILDWVAIPFSRVPSQPRDWTCISSIDRWILSIWATKEVHI